MTDTAPSPPPGPEIVIAGHAFPRRTLWFGLAGAAVLALILAVVLTDRGEPKADSGQRLAIAVQPAPKPKPLPISKSDDPLNAIPPEAANLPDNPPQPVAPPAAIPVIDEPPARRASASPSFDCASAGGRAEQMICADDRLAAADRRMDRAFQDALDAGVPMRILRRQQRAFLDARDEAARHGPDAVADIYGERIAELEGMAQGY